jgi:hypothetical protein
VLSISCKEATVVLELLGSFLRPEDVLWVWETWPGLHFKEVVLGTQTEVS